jgi:2-haloalkanoic acid dehalogenase type II
MERPYDIITFDCYGTLIDWEAGIRGAFAGAGLDADAALAAYTEIEPVAERETYRRYRDVLTATARAVAERLGVPIAEASFLADSLPSWTPFADTNAALERLKAAGIRLGILSNIDDDLLAATRKHFTVPFDLIVTAQEMRSYKPAEPHFRTARERIGNARWLHAAQSNFHDIVPANALGIDTAWINRHGEPARPGGTPKFEFRNLTQLADAVAR